MGTNEVRLPLLLELVKRLRERYSDNIALQFDIYRIAGSGAQRSAPRRAEYVAIADVNEQWWSEQLSNLAPDEEIALRSKVQMLSGVVGHIPMIDFTSDDANVVKERCAQMADDWDMEDYVIVPSGRSFHAYWPFLLTHEYWSKFMGDSIILGSGIDIRWIGHSLGRGYGCLRWSQNTSRYVHV